MPRASTSVGEKQSQNSKAKAMRDEKAVNERTNRKAKGDRMNKRRLYSQSESPKIALLSSLLAATTAVQAFSSSVPFSRPTPRPSSDSNTKGSSSKPLTSRLQQRHPELLISASTGIFGTTSTSIMMSNKSISDDANDGNKDDSNNNDSTASLPIQFGRFTISPSQLFHRSPSGLSAAIVNLRPIVPGHVLVISTRVVPHLADLTEEEHADLWSTVRRVQDMLGRRYFGGRIAGDDCEETSAEKGESGDIPPAPVPAAFNVAVQDGRNAGQSVPHVHVHILPRIGGDFARNDDVYDELEAWAPRAEDSEAKKQQAGRLEVLEDEDRKDRTMEQMGQEADEYRELMR